MRELQDIDLKALIEQETGERFNRNGHINCCFHNEKTPSMSVKFFPDANKQRYKCWGCNATGDAIDFIIKYKNYEYNEARKYLDLEVEYSPVESFEETIKQFVRNQVAKGNKQGYKPLGIFTFVNANNNPIYSKVKFLKPDGKKETPYYHIENGQVITSRGHDEVPYNYYNLLKGIADNKIIVICEGEKDVNTLSHMLPKTQYVVTSLKGFKDYDKIKSNNMQIYVIGDTGEAGRKYINEIKYNFLSSCKTFKIINLKNIQALGNNKDVTDWLEVGHTKEDLLNCFNRSLDLKDKNQLQQDFNGVYYLKYDKKTEEYNKEYLTNFNVLEASKINKVDAEVQGIRLKIKSCIDGKITEKIAESTKFDDVRAFRNFLGIDYSFIGKGVNEVVKLKDWINKYFALESKDIYSGAKFLPVDNKFQLITSTGTLTSDSKDYSTIAEKNKIDIMDIEEITKEELKELIKYLFAFCDYKKALSIIGSAISFLLVGQNIATNEKLHHLLIVGESGSGKSTILERVVAPLLNYPVEEKKAISTTNFAIQNMLSTGNYPVLFDEFKPSMINVNKMQSISDTLRNLYDRTTISRGNKNLQLNEYKLTRPVVIAGEESFPNSEKALVTRSCIVYISKHERTEENTESMIWLMDNEDLLKKLGKSIITQVLKMPVEEYKNLRITLRELFTLKDRPLNTAINIATGIELLNKVLINANLEPIVDYCSEIQTNIQEEVLDNEDDACSEVEKMILIYNDMLQDNNRFVNDETIQKGKHFSNFGKLYIRTQLMLQSIYKACNDTKEIDSKTLLKSKDFKKQAEKAGYLKVQRATQIKIGEYNQAKAWFDEYDIELLKKLGADSIVNADYWEERKLGVI